MVAGEADLVIINVMDRRRFAQLSASAFASSQLPVSAHETGGAPTAATRRVGFAPVGLGSIAEVFMQAVGKTPNARISGLVTGHPAEKGVKFGSQYKVGQESIYTYETFGLMRDNRDIDAVYIALPNSMHCEYAVRAAEAGKHVLCEKPMAISSAECRRMIDACRHANVKLMVAYRIHFDATFRKVRDLVLSGAFGEIEAFQGGFYGMKNKQQWRLDRTLAGGGSLLDLGIYPLNAIRWMTGEEPAEFRAFTATREKGPKFASVEQSVDWLMKFPSGILANCGSSYGQSGTDFLQINGSTGHVRIEPAFGYGDVVLKYSGRTASGEISGSGPVYEPDQFVTETTHFADCVLNNKQPVTPGEEGLADLVAIEAIYKAAGAPIA
jgi:predicted dehydrogenase